MENVFLGVDVGGSGIKAAPVDVTTGKLTSERVRLKTPQPATPAAVAESVKEAVSGFRTEGTVGLGFPAVVRANGAVETAMNIHPDWIGSNVIEVIGGALGRDVVAINDADAAAIAEFDFGAAAGVMGTVIVLTFGTGIGSAIAVDGVLARNVELGVLELDGHAPAEKFFSAKVRRREDLSWVEWGQRANRYLVHIDRVFTPDLIVVGGGLTKHWERYAPMFDESLPLKPAAAGNDAGLIGAALWASQY